MSGITSKIGLTVGTLSVLLTACVSENLFQPVGPSTGSARSGAVETSITLRKGQYIIIVSGDQPPVWKAV